MSEINEVKYIEATVNKADTGVESQQSFSSSPTLKSGNESTRSKVRSQYKTIIQNGVKRILTK